MDVTGMSADHKRALAADPETDPDTLAVLSKDLMLAATVAENPSTPSAVRERIYQDFPHLLPKVELEPTSDGLEDAFANFRQRSAATARINQAGRVGSASSGGVVEVLDVSGPNAFASRPRPLLARMSRRARVISGAAAVAAIVAVALIATLVVAPRQSASKAAAASAAAAQQAQQAHDTAVSHFNNAVGACTSANAALSNAQNRATSTATTDPSTLKDPTLLDKLSAAVAAASGVTACTAPTMGSDTDTIQQQAGDTSTAVGTVQSAVDSLGAAVAAVMSSAQAKNDDAAAATQQAEAAAAVAWHTWHFTSNDGYTFDLSLQIGSSVTDDTFTYVPSGHDSCNKIAALPGGDQVQCETAKLADICSDFDASTMIAIPITATFTATTKGFDTPVAARFALGTTGKYGGPDQLATSQVEVATVYSGDGPQCTGPSGYGALPSLGVNFANPMKTGATGTFQFDVILQKWRTPGSPSGDSALLDYLTVVPSGTTASGTTTSYSPDSQKMLTLSNAAVGG